MRGVAYDPAFRAKLMALHEQGVSQRSQSAVPPRSARTIALLRGLDETANFVASAIGSADTMPFPLKTSMTI
jgi:hypothetical protein